MLEGSNLTLPNLPRAQGWSARADVMLGMDSIHMETVVTAESGCCWHSCRARCLQPEEGFETSLRSW